MKLSIFKFLLPAIVALAIAPRMSAINLRPNHVACQTGGGMGAVSFGTGWEYGSHNRWETDVFVGIVPKYDSESTKASITLKENFIPWHIRLNESITIQPLTSSIYFSTLLSSKVWTRLPQKYPSGYYAPQTRIRANISFGQRIKWKPAKRLKGIESISAYYEFGTCDIYLLSAVGNSKVKLRDILQLCIGMKIDLKK